MFRPFVLSLMAFSLLILAIAHAEPTERQTDLHLRDWAEQQRILIHPVGGTGHSNYFGALDGWVSQADAVKVWHELYMFTRDPKYLDRLRQFETTFRDPLNLPHNFILRQKWFSFPTAEFEIKQGKQVLGTVVEKFFSLTRSFEVRDAVKKKIGSARQKMFSWGVEIEVFDAQDQKIGSIKEQIWKSIWKWTTTYSILDAQGRVLATSEKVDWIGTRFDVNSASSRLIHMERPWLQWTLTDEWKVELFDKEKVHPFLLLMSAVYKTSVDNERRAASRDSDD